MDLQKIYADSDFENAVVPEGQILLFSGTENGKVVTRYKDSSGNFGTLSGGGGADVTLGQINADGNFQPLAFDGQTASNSGSPETVENYYGWNGVLPVPDNGIKVGDAVYYKCASVDTASKTWTGYKAVLTGGVYTFEENVTAGLTYGTAYKPVADYVYNADATVRIDKLWDGVSAYRYMRWLVTAVRSGSDVQAAEFELITNENTKEDWSKFPELTLSGNEEQSSSADPPSRLIDGDLSGSNKWLDYNFISPCWVQFDFQSPVFVPGNYYGYRWYTANDMPGRDPVSWKIQVSEDGIEWIDISVVYNAEITEDRQVIAGTWQFTM